MRYITIKNTSLNASNIALGTDTFGSLTDKNTSFELLDFYYNYGGNLIDTAECYANWLENGVHASETLIGNWLYERNLRNKILISTKGGHYQYGQPHRLTKNDIETDLNGSLKRLKTDYIDIYWLHRDATDAPAGEIMEILSETVKSGKVRYIGLSNWSNKRFSEALQYTEKHSLPQPVASQIQYSAAYPNPEKNEPDLILMNNEEYSFFKSSSMTVFAYASQAKGFFSKFLHGGIEALSKKAYSRYYNAETLKRFENLKALYPQKNCSINSLALAALINRNDFDTIPIIGCKSVDQLKDSLSASDIILTKSETDFIFNRKD